MHFCLRSKLGRLTRFAFAAFAFGLVLAGAGCKSTHVGPDALGGATGSGGGAVGGAAGSGAMGGTAGGGSTGNDGSAGSAGSDPCTTALFCDDFEKYAASAAPTTPWRASTNMGTVTVDGAFGHSGAQSIKMTTQARTTDGIKTAFIELAGDGVFPVAGNVFYGRMMFYLDAAPTTSVHWTLIQGAGVVPGATYHALYRYGGQLPVMQGATFVGSQLMANYDTPDSYPIGSGTPPASDCWQHADKVVVPVGRWACVEWKFDGPNNRMNLWLDGAAVPSLTMNGTGQGCVNQPATPPFTWTAPNFDRLDLGWESYQTDGVRTIHVDDVVISKTQVGCPP